MSRIKINKWTEYATQNPREKVSEISIGSGSELHGWP